MLSCVQRQNKNRKEDADAVVLAWADPEGSSIARAMREEIVVTDMCTHRFLEKPSSNL